MPDFLETLNTAAEIGVDRIWAVVWQSTILTAALAMVAGLFLRNSSPGLRYWVWQILAIKLLLMPVWIYAIRLPQLPRAKMYGPIANSAAVNSAGVDLRHAPLRLPQRPTVTEMASDKVDSLPGVDQSPRHPKAPVADGAWRITWQSWLLFAWAGGVLAQIARLLSQWYRLGRLLRQAAPADDTLLKLLAVASAQMGISRAPQAYLTEVDCSPFVCGIRRPAIVMSRKLAAALSPTELSHVLLHELAHVRRRDLMWGWVCVISRLVYFFHPVMHWICYRLRLECELACDEIAMSLTGHDAHEYAATLVHVVSHSSEPAVFRMDAASAGLSGENR